jgi:diguanylate cyclase (GGDEF)-like protein
MMRGPFPGETFILEPRTEITIGRGAGNDVRLPFTDISRLHAKAKCSASGKVEITDIGSTNGTYINGRRQLYRVLREGDKIQFGENVVFRFAFSDEVDEEFQARLFGVPFLDRVSNTLNRDRFLTDLRQAHEGAAAGGTELATLVMVIDGFDLLEQLLGFAVRDYFVRELGWVIRKTVAGEAALYRVESDAFATLFHGLPAAGALDAAERMRSAVASSRLTHEGDQMAFSLGVGIASLQADHPADAESMLALAAERGRQATAAGGDRVLAGAGSV